MSGGGRAGEDGQSEECHRGDAADGSDVEEAQQALAAGDGQAGDGP